MSNQDKFVGWILFGYAIISFFLQPYSYRIAELLGMPAAGGGQLAVNFILNPIVAVLSNYQLGLSTSMSTWFINIFYYLWAGIIAFIGIIRLFRN